MGYATITIDGIGESAMPLCRLELFREPYLEPRLERDVFSGGVNESARFRNEQLLDASVVYVTGNKVVGPEHMLCALAACAGSHFSMRRKHPALRAWLDLWCRLFRERHEFEKQKAQADDLLRRIDVALGKDKSTHA